MADDFNDNMPGGTAGGPAIDHHGQAAYLLAESLLHELIAGSVITRDIAVKVVELAADTGGALAAETGWRRPVDGAKDILDTLVTSLRADLKA